MSKEPIIIHNDIHDVRGNLVLREGTVVTRKVLTEMPKPPVQKMVPLRLTAFYSDFELVMMNPDFVTPLGDAEISQRIMGVLGKIELPQLIIEELEALKKLSALLYMHSVGTTLLVLRAVLETDGKLDEFARLARANLVKDVGMIRLPPELMRNTDHLTPAEYTVIKRHPVIGMVLNHYYFGEGLESMISLRHHERGGFGYPTVAADKPSQLVEVVTAMDVFYALASPRPFRRQSFDVRGAIDELADLSKRGEVALWAIKVIVSMFRQDDTPIAAVQVSDQRLGFVPEQNYYGITKG